MKFLLPKSISHAVVTYLVKKYGESGQGPLGRTILQKICYFAKAKGVNLPFSFQIYHYGPFSQEVFSVADSLLIDNVIKDASSDPKSRSEYKVGPNAEPLLKKFSPQLRKIKTKLDSVVETFRELNPTEMELVSTVHYVATSTSEWFNKPVSKEEVVNTVMEFKGSKFPKETVARVYDVLSRAGLLK